MANLYGFNTDVAGVVRPLETAHRFPGAKILVLGAGGAAACRCLWTQERSAEVYILNRTPGPAQTLAKQAKARAINRTMLKKMEFDVIINATPVGMDGNRDPLPNTEQELKTKYFFEMVYSPAETKMVKIARAKGMHVILGSKCLSSRARASLKPGPANPRRSWKCSEWWNTHWRNARSRNRLKPKRKAKEADGRPGYLPYFYPTVTEIGKPALACRINTWTFPC